MKQRSGPVTPTSLSQVRRQFERWRASRKFGTRIPEDLWQAATAVGCELSVSKVAQELRLDYYKLRGRVESTAEEKVSTGPPPSEKGFLEIPLRAISGPDYVLEVEAPDGARLRVELKGAAPRDLETTVRTLWSLAR